MMIHAECYLGAYNQWCWCACNHIHMYSLCLCGDRIRGGGWGITTHPHFVIPLVLYSGMWFPTLSWRIKTLGDRFIWCKFLVNLNVCHWHITLLQMVHGPAGQMLHFIINIVRDWLWAAWPRGQSSCPSKVKNFHFSTLSRPALGPIQPPIQWVPGALSFGVKWQEYEANHSPPTSAEVKKTLIYTSTTPYVFMV
jgi:hypothetical protein